MWWFYSNTSTPWRASHNGGPKSCVLVGTNNTAALRHFCCRMVTEWDKRRGARRQQKISIAYENRLVIFQSSNERHCLLHFFFFLALDLTVVKWTLNSVETQHWVQLSCKEHRLLGRCSLKVSDSLWQMCWVDFICFSHVFLRFEKHRLFFDNFILWLLVQLVLEARDSPQGPVLGLQFNHQKRETWVPPKFRKATFKIFFIRLILQHLKAFL